ncbi:MAG: flagellar hook-length control protein FliK, partial [Burkholderiales bacterium]|nr:flagellar hook-length control protein FliK [Burkholderiales bacterium]
AGTPAATQTAISATSGNVADKRLTATVGAALLKGADANGAAQGDAAPGAQLDAAAAGGKMLEPAGAKSGKSGAAPASQGGSRQAGASADGQGATQNALLNQVAQAVQASQANQATQTAQAAAQIQAAQAGSNTAAAAQPAVPLQAAAPLMMTLTPHLDDSAHWGQALSQQVVWLSSAHQQSAALQLNPPDLGPLHVVLNVADNQAQALFVSAHAAVRDAVQAALPQLRASLADNGIALGNTMVSADSSQQQQAFQQFNAQARQNGSRQSGPASVGGPGSLAGASATTAAARIARGLVDTFA